MGRYRFLLRPRWLLLHALALLLAVTMINLGLWQLRRLQEKRDHNRLLDERAAGAVLDVAAGPSPDARGVDRLAYRDGVAVGTYRSDEEVLVRSRSLESEPGAWVLTPLRLADGRELVVNRGWIPTNSYPELPPPAAAPPGQVTVRGLLLPSQQRGRFGPRDPADGRLTTLARADLVRLQAQVPEPLYPLYLQLQAQDPPPSELPVLLPPPERSEGPHLSYAVQWFLFTVIGVTGYALMIRKSGRLAGRPDVADPGSAEAGVAQPGSTEPGGDGAGELDAAPPGAPPLPGVPPWRKMPDGRLVPAPAPGRAAAAVPGDPPASNADRTVTATVTAAGVDGAGEGEGAAPVRGGGRAAGRP